MAQDQSNKDKQMAARLKAQGIERWTGRCVICGATIRNGAETFNHYSRHAFGSDSKQ